MEEIIEIAYSEGSEENAMFPTPFLWCQVAFTPDQVVSKASWGYFFLANRTTERLSHELADLMVTIDSR
jgi:hypothetical protein